MLSTVELLDAARAYQGGVSDYRIAQLLGVSGNHVSNYRCRRSTPANPIAARLAALAGLDPAEVVSWVNIERSSAPADREVWEMILSRVAPVKTRRPAAKLGIMPTAAKPKTRSKTTS